MWEYNRFEFKLKGINELIDKLNRLGTDDWGIIYYQETKPPKFGEDWIIVVIVKRLKPA
jgi:hypothetical protein